MPLISKTIAVFEHPFNVSGFDETLPAGAYELETEECPPPDRLDPEAWKASAFVRLHTRTSHPALAGVLTVALTDLDRARAKDMASGKALTDFFLEEMLRDPLGDAIGCRTADMCRRDEASIRAAENEGMPVRA